VKNTVALVAIVAGLILFPGCRNKESPAQTTAAREDRKPPAGAASAANSPQRADRGQTTSGRPHEKDADLLEEMK
jgi:hypothetical protein